MNFLVYPFPLDLIKFESWCSKHSSFIRRWPSFFFFLSQNKYLKIEFSIGLNLIGDCNMSVFFPPQKTVYGANVVIFEGILAFANKELLKVHDFLFAVMFEQKLKKSLHTNVSTFSSSSRLTLIMWTYEAIGRSSICGNLVNEANSFGCVKASFNSMFISYVRTGSFVARPSPVVKW